MEQWGWFPKRTVVSNQFILNMDFPRCLVLIYDEALRTKLRTLFQERKIDCYFVQRGDHLTQLVKNWTPFMMLLDLTGPSSEWLFKHISEIQTAHPGFPIVAMISEAEEATHQRLETYGCRFVLAESELLEKLPETVELILSRRV